MKCLKVNSHCARRSNREVLDLIASCSIAPSVTFRLLRRCVTDRRQCERAVNSIAAKSSLAGTIKFLRVSSMSHGCSSAFQHFISVSNPRCMPVTMNHYCRLRKSIQICGIHWIQVKIRVGQKGMKFKTDYIILC